MKRFGSFVLRQGQQQARQIQAVHHQQPQQQRIPQQQQKQQSSPSETADPKITSVQPDPTKRMIGVEWEDGRSASFPYVWLRDCAPFALQPEDGGGDDTGTGGKFETPPCRAPSSTMMADTRTLTLNELNVQVKPEKVKLHPGGESVFIQWPPYNEVIYKSRWLRDHVWTPPGLTASANRVTLWGRSDLEQCLPETTAEELCADADSRGGGKLIAEKLREFAKYGVLLVRGGGGGNDDGRALKALGYDAERELLLHHDGPNNKFRAYPHHVQGMHTGGAFKPTIPPLCLLFIREEPEDIALQICDGYRVANLLRDAHPTLFTFLCNTLIEYTMNGKKHDSNNNNSSSDEKSSTHRWPVFTLTASGEVQQVVFNNALRSPRTNVPLETVEDYYKALKTFNSYCYQSRNMFNLRVREGDLVVIANQRILHGNPAFSENVANWVDEVFLSDEPLIQTLKQIKA